MGNKIATRAAYGKALAALGEKNQKIVVLDADLSHATMTCNFADKFPERFFNMGIAEANMVDTAVGMSEMGLIPFVSTMAIFGAGRAYEMVRNSVAYPKSNVKLAMTHGGISVGEDGGSHAAIEDIALMRVLPGMTVICPCDEDETAQAIEAAAAMQGPVYIRMARLETTNYEKNRFEIGKANVLREGNDLAIFACGTMVEAALNTAELLEKEGINAAVINIHTIKPIDAKCIQKYAKQCGKVVTIEEHSVIGGLGDAVSEVLLERGCCPLKKLGVQDEFGQSGKPRELLDYYRLTPEKILEDIRSFLK